MEKDCDNYFWELVEEEGIKLPDYVKHVIETLELNSLDAFQELDASHIQKIKSIIMKQKKNFGPEIQKTLFEIKNKIRTQKKQLFSALRLKLRNQSETDEVFLIEDTEIEMPNESTQMITDSSLDQTVEQKTLDPEFLERMEDENFCNQIITKLDNNLKQYIYKFTDVEKIEKSTLVINKGKLQGRSKCPECGGVFVVQANVRRMNVKWIPSNMRKHYNRHFKILLKEEGQDSESLVKSENANEFSAAGLEYGTQDEKGTKKPKKVQSKEKSPKKLVKKEKDQRLVKIIMPRMKMETITSDFEEIPDSVPENHSQYEEIMAEQSMEVLDEEHYQPDEGQEEEHEIYQEDQGENQDEQEHYFDEERLEEEELEAPEEPQEPAQKKMKREPLDYSEIVDERDTSELVFNPPQNPKKKSFHLIEEDDPDWLYCKTICAMMKTMPLDVRNQLKIEILTMTTQKQLELMSK